MVANNSVRCPAALLKRTCHCDVVLKSASLCKEKSKAKVPGPDPNIRFFPLSLSVSSAIKKDISCESLDSSGNCFVKSPGKVAEKKEITLKNKRTKGSHKRLNFIPSSLTFR